MLPSLIRDAIPDTFSFFNVLKCLARRCSNDRYYFCASVCSKIAWKAFLDIISQKVSKMKYILIWTDCKMSLVPTQTHCLWFAHSLQPKNLLNAEKLQKGAVVIQNNTPQHVSRLTDFNANVFIRECLERFAFCFMCVYIHCDWAALSTNVIPVDRHHMLFLEVFIYLNMFLWSTGASLGQEDLNCLFSTCKSPEIFQHTSQS